MASSSSSPSFFCVLTLLSLLSLASSSKDDIPATITIPLTSRFIDNPSADPVLFLQQVASESLSRVHYLKYGKGGSHLQTPLFPISSGVHSIDLSFGTPPQTIPFMVDTGSDVVWFPCTTHFVCINCSTDGKHKKTPTFNPKLSSSSKILGCENPKCVNTSSPDIPLGCPRCNSSSKRCSKACPPYSLQYGRGASAGFFLLENLKFPRKTFHDFLVGCSTSSEIFSIAIAGFGNTTFSLPLQMGAKKFAYCLKSHKFDDTGNSSKLFLDYNDGETKGLIYTPFLESPPEFSLYYYLSVEDIMIGDEVLRIPHKYLAPGPDSRGGVIIDSGFTYGYMTKPVFRIVSAELKRQMSKYRRSIEVEVETGFSPCYNLTGEKSIIIPDLVYKFTSGASMVIAGEKYFKSFPMYHLWCFPVTTDDPGSLEFTPGPSVILGNYQQVDFYLEFDLNSKRFGFRKQTC